MRVGGAGAGVPPGHLTVNHGVAILATICCWWKNGFSPEWLKVDTEVTYVEILVGAGRAPVVSDTLGEPFRKPLAAAEAVDGSQ